MWFIILLAMFVLVLFAVIVGGSIVLATSIYRNFLRPGVNPAPLNKQWTIVVVAILVALLLPATVSPYAGYIIIKPILLVLLAITAWAVIWQRTTPRRKGTAKRSRPIAKKKTSASRKVKKIKK